MFLEDINDGFLEELKNVFGTNSVDYYSKLETIDRAYYFIRFGIEKSYFRKISEEEKKRV